MATNWDAILSNTNNLQDVLSILKKVLASLDIKADITTIDEALTLINSLDADVQEKLGILSEELANFDAQKDLLIQSFQTEANEAISKVENTGGLISAPTLTALQAITPEYDYQLARVDATGDEYRWNPALTTTVKWEPTGRNFLSESKAYTDNKVGALKTDIMRALYARYGISKNLLNTNYSSSNSNLIQTVVRYSGASISLSGIFCAVRVKVEGANYPTAPNDSSVFATPLRVEGYANGGWALRQNLVRLEGTDVWFFKSDNLNITNITELKISTYPASGVTVSFENAVIQNDSGFGNPEIDARNAAIAESLDTKYKTELLSLLSDTYNLLGTKTSATSNSTINLSNSFTENLERFSAVCVIESDGTYPTENYANKNFAVRIELLNGSTAARSTFLKRLGTSKIWYINDADASGFTPTQVKLYAQKLSDATYITVKNAVISKTSFPNPIAALIAQGVDMNEVIEAVTPIITSQVTAQIAQLDIGVPPLTALEALSKASERRVDFVMLGDSNQLMDGWGFSWAFGKALVDRFGSYATSFVRAPLGTAGTTTGADAAFNQHILATSGIDSYSYVADGLTIPTGTANGVFTNPNPTSAPYNNLNPSSNLRCHFKYGTFADGAGSFRCGVRREEAPWTVFKLDDVINTNTGTISATDDYFDLEAGSRANMPLSFKWVMPSGTPITGKFIGFWMRVEDRDKTNGVSVHTLYGSGGQSLYDFTNDMLNVKTDAMLINLFSNIRKLQLDKGQQPIVVIYINSGANDRNETSTPSWGYRASTTPDSATAYIDNLEALTMRFKNIWQKNGWDEKELFFLIVPTHPISSPDDAKLVSYRKAAYAFAHNHNRVSFVNFENLTNYTEMAANNWYRTGTSEVIHLSKAGYLALAQKVVNLIATAP